MIPADSSGADAPIDLAALSHLMGGVASDALAQMLVSFWKLEGDAPKALRALAEARDGEGLAAAAHGAKGAVSLICAPAATNLCKALELSARAGDWATVAVLLSEVDTAYANICVFIAELGKD